MIHTQICFQCPNCNSFNTVMKNIRAVPLEAHEGYYYLDTDLLCRDCGANFSKKFTSPAPHDFKKNFDKIIKEGSRPQCFRLSLNIEGYNGEE